MISRIHSKLGTAGFIISILALVVALGGGAYAASGGLTGKQKKEVEKIAKKYAGKPGTNGTNGTNGAPGAKGDTGAAGSNGTNGTNGSPGGAGAAGKSVEEISIAAGGGEVACEERGGAEYLLEGAAEGTEICNGEAGSPWTVGGTLPKGATETGTWSLSGSEASANEQDIMYAPLSLPIPLAAPLAEADIHVVDEGEVGTCTGSYTHPTAPEGTLCVYYQGVENAEVGFVASLEGEPNALSHAGGYLVFFEVKDHAWSRGSFAVTGG